MSLTQINKAGLDEIALDHVFTIGASGSSAYTFQGEGLNGTVNNPTLYLTRGKTYRFENGSGGHPIRIQSTSGASGTAYNTGVTNNAGSGTVIVEVQHDAPDVLYYQCTSHAAMNGILYITGALADGGVTTAKIANNAVTTNKVADNNITEAKLATNSVSEDKITNANVTTAKLADGTVTTAKIADGNVTTAKIDAGAVVEAKINNNAITGAKIVDGNVTEAKLGASSVTAAKIASNAVITSKIADSNVTTAKIADDAVTGAKIADTTVDTNNIVNNSVTTVKLADQAVTLDKLPHGTSSNDGKFLRANNGADPSFETVPSTTINNNADNRVITGSGTANTLNGESLVTIDASGRLSVSPNAGGSGITLASQGSTYGGTVTLRNTQNSNQDWLIGVGGGDSAYVNGRGFLIRENTSGHNSFMIKTNGYVGINEINPQQQLHVHDDAAYKGILINGNGAPRCAFARSTTTTGEWSVGIDGTNGNHFVINNSNDNSNTKVLVKSDGVSLAGTVTMSSQPSFSAYNTTNTDVTWSHNYHFPFNAEHYDVGSNFNTSNGRFTAPVSGKYQFNFATIIRGNDHNREIAFTVNGSSHKRILSSFSWQSGTSYYDYMSWAVLINLSANDYVFVKNVTGNSRNITVHGAEYSTFSGYLVA